MAESRVVQVPKLNFPFRGVPYAQLPGVQEECDPAPAYPHDEKITRKALREVEKCFAVPNRPTIYLLHHEGLARTNGWACRDHVYDDERGEWSKDRWNGIICFSAKRIPPHPAVTRYLVAHEYGHHVDFEIGRRRGADPYGSEDQVRSEYEKVRGLDEGTCEAFYGCGSWHSSVGELLANDFRILVAEVEPEYWPHPGLKRPEKVAGLRRWWREALA